MKIEKNTYFGKTRGSFRERMKMILVGLAGALDFAIYLLTFTYITSEFRTNLLFSDWMEL